MKGAAASSSGVACYCPFIGGLSCLSMQAHIQDQGPRMARPVNVLANQVPPFQRRQSFNAIFGGTNRGRAIQPRVIQEHSKFLAKALRLC